MSDMPPRDEPGGATWMITFADLMSLLVTFFVMLFAMSAIEITKWREVTAVLQSSPRVVAKDDGSVPGAERSVVASPQQRHAANLDYLAGVLADLLRVEPTLSGLIITRLEDRLVIAMRGADLFDAEALSARGARDVRVLGSVLRHIGNQVDIVGHATGEEAWRRSMIRADLVAEALNAGGYSRRMATLGAGDGTTIEGGRRPGIGVEIIVRQVRAS